MQDMSPDNLLGPNHFDFSTRQKVSSDAQDQQQFTELVTKEKDPHKQGKPYMTYLQEDDMNTLKNSSSPDSSEFSTLQKEFNLQTIDSVSQRIKQISELDIFSLFLREQRR